MAKEKDKIEMDAYKKLNDFENEEDKKVSAALDQYKRKLDKFTAIEKDKIKQREMSALNDENQKENNKKDINKTKNIKDERLQKDKDELRRKEKKELQMMKNNLALKNLLVESDMEKEQSEHLKLSNDNHMLDTENEKKDRVATEVKERQEKDDELGPVVTNLRDDKEDAKELETEINDMKGQLKGRGAGGKHD